jgi:K+-sensing histidine kinase KdpD
MRIIGKMDRRLVRALQGYFLAVILVALATWLKELAEPDIIPSDVPITYILAIVPTAVFFGFGPSILVCILSLLVYDYFFIPPIHHFDLSAVQNAPILVIFLIVGLLISYLASHLRKKNVEAVREIAARKQSETELVKYRDHLEELVTLRTNELEKVNSELTEDVAQRRKAEEALRKFASQVEAANKEMEAFSYSVSHDLRTPLRSLDGFAHMVLEDYEDKLDETGKDYLRRIKQSSEHMSGLIDDMLRLSRIGRADMCRNKVDLSAAAISIAEDLKHSAPNRQAEFKISPGIMADGDENLLSIALTNLLENAWKYTRNCPKTLIEMGEVQKDGKKEYFIKDNGTGFDMQYAARLFEPFQRLHSDKEYEGSGIGLAIVQRIIRRHEGEIRAESEPGKGATFYFTLGQ